VGDLKERERWDDYMQYYEKQLTILLQTTPLVCNSTDDKEMCRYIVGKIIWEEMQKYKG
jgi:polyphosphate kinase 2 (PPK2 family)